MMPLRLIGLMVVVFLISLPATFLMNAGPSIWSFSSDADEPGEEKEDRDDPVVDVLCLKAMKEVGDGNHAKAITIYTKAIERGPKYSFSYLGRGDVYLLQGDLDRALQDYNQAARLDPDNPAARERLEIMRKAQAEK
ncbi:MAG TPA: tetratricopeptide repeat protein [Gemmataceae bacterium]|nr:tetratricopeptide repeat protein [Gemmataceae bacterium]